MFKTISEVKKANKEIGQFFFEKTTMRFFNSRIESGILKGRFFITSERFNEDAPRLFTLREVKPDGKVETLGEFQEFATIQEAKEYLKNHLKGI